MKKRITKWVALIAILFVPFALFSQEYGKILIEGFEDGIPQEWQQEKVSGDLAWTIESGELTRPKNAFEGVKRVAFRNTTGVTSKAKTRLILPQMDISGLYQPILVFAHAQDKWTDDFDTLKVLYRTSSDVDWTELKVFDKYIPKWTIDTVRLIGANRTYQIAFEATDNLGRGVVLDNIELRSTPNCITPYSLNVSKISNDAATIGWLGSFDAESFSLKVSTTELTAEQLADETFKVDVLDTVLSDVWSCDLKKLEQGKTYYYYLKSNCENEASEWASSSFKTSNFLHLPYYEQFKSVETPGFVSYVTGWYGDGTTTKPYVNSGNTNDKNQTSVDGSYVLCFNGSSSNTGRTDIPGGQYCYTALPEINIPSLDVLQVSFWTIRYYPLDSERFSIIVGVMTDPTIKGSFVPVDTINITTIRDYVECVVSLESYKGEGKYIAFMSDFAESNIFLMDNLVVDYRKDLQKVTFDLGMPSASSLKFDFKQNYEKYEVVVSSAKFDSIKHLETATDVLRGEVVNGGVLENVAPRSVHYVYARAIKGTEKGEWSNPIRIRMPGKTTTYPYLVDFELNKNVDSTYYCAQQGIYINTAGRLVHDIIYLTNYTSNAAVTDTYWTSTTTTTPARTPNELQITASISENSWMTVVMPEMKDGKNTRVSFWAGNHSQYNGSTFYVGVMSDANDASTFVAIDTITLELGYTFLEYELNKYNVNGNFFAFKIDKAHYVEEDFTSNYVYIDNVLFEDIPECSFPSDIEVISNPRDPSEVTLKWAANGVTSWNVRLATTPYERDSFYVEGLNYTFLYDTIVTTNSIMFKGLDAPMAKHYYWIQPICGSEKGQWTVGYEFETECYGITPLPYEENFDDEDYKTGAGEKVFTVPCMHTNLVLYTYSGSGSSSTSYYPYLTSAKDGATGNSLYLTEQSSWNGKYTYVALPKMEEAVNKLQLSFRMYVTDAKYMVAVGVMTDPLDSTTFEMVKEVKAKFINEYVEYIVTFENYKGNGEYIAIRSYNPNALTTLYTYIDDIKVDRAVSCARPEDLALMDISNSTAKIGWTKATATQWRVLISKERMSAAQLMEPDSAASFVLMDTVTATPHTVSGLEDNTAYYAYVQTLCADGVSAWSNPLPFRTSCVVLEVGELGVENFDTYEVGNGKYPPCYIVGNVSNPSSGTYIPACNATYKHSGGASLKIQTTTTYNGAYVITSRLDISDISMLKAKFWGSTGSESNAKNTYAHSLVVGVITDPTDISTFWPVDTLNFAFEGRPFEVSFASYKYDANGDKGKYVMFWSEFDKNNTVYIDDLEFDTIPVCVTEYDIENITHNSIDVKFVKGGAPYQLKYATSMCTIEQLNMDSLPVINVTTGDKVTISNLEPNTNYYLYARSTCDTIESDWTNVEVVTTSCLELLSLPFSDDFENQATTGSHPVCYNVFSGSTSYPAPNTTANSGKRGIYFYATSSYTSYLVTQEIDVDNLAKCQVGFYMRANTTNKDRSIIVGVVSNIDSIAETFVPVDTIILNQAANSYESQLVSLESYVGTGKYVAFTTSYQLNEKASGGAYIDDIIIELIPTCAKPTDFELIDITDKSISLGYNHETATNFEFKYGAVDFNPEVDGTSVEVTGKSVAITGLTKETKYDVYIRACCSATEKSPWTLIGTYTTISEPYTQFPYTFGFEDEAEAAKWHFAQEEQPNQWYIGTDTAFVVTDSVNNGGKALYVSKDGGLSAQYREAKDENNNAATSYSWAYRPITLEPGVYNVSYDWTCYGEGTSDYVRAGLLPVTSTFAAGANKVTAKDGTSVSFTYTTSTQPKGWIELSEEYSAGNYKLNLVDTTKAFAEQWESINEVLFIDDSNAGTYNLVFYWKNDASTGKYAAKRSAVIDNISITKETCIQPINLVVTDFTSSTADVTWQSYLCTPKSYEYVVTTEADVAPSMLTAEQIVKRNFVNATTIHIEGLAENTPYYFYVRSICAEGDTSFWSESASFKTVCTPQQIDTVYNMDSEDGYYLPSYASGTGTNTSYKVPNCFINSHDTLVFTSGNAAYIPYLYKNTTSAIYSRSGDYCLRFYRTNNTTHPGGIIALPIVDGDLEELQLNFWMRCVHNNKTTGKLTVTGLGSTYNRKITVGTMTDPYDPSTFEPLGVFEYPYKTGDLTTSTLITNDESGNNYWVECNMPLTGAKGKYIAFKNEGYEDATTSNLVYIDDISVTPLSCTTPAGIEFDSLTATSVKVNAITSEAEKYVIQIANNEEFTNARMDTVTALPANIENLAPATEYFVKIQSLCSAEDVSKWSQVASFTTMTQLSYTQVFSNSSYRPADWSQASSPTLDDYLSGKTTTFSMMQSTGSGGYSSEDAMFDEGMFSTRHISVGVISTNKYWLFTPKFEMPNKEQLHLVFDAALTAQNSNTAVSEEDLLFNDDRFVVIVSEDAGKTWTRENMTVWGHDYTADYKLFDIPHTGKQYELDMSKYAGKSIQIAFYVESTVSSSAKIEFHLDNVHINEYKVEKLAEASCQTEDFEYEQFYFNSNDLNVGLNEFRYLDKSDKAADVKYELNLVVTPMVEKVIEASICEGDVYAKNNFSELTQAGVYKQKHVSASGCDSVVTLNLSVTKAENIMTFDTICYGSSVVWNGVEYNKTGVHVDTLVSKVTGCDSIVTFVLTVKDAIRTEQYQNICFGATYQFGTQTIDKSGDYTEKFVTAAGCDSIVTLHAIVLPDYRTTINATISKGDRYDKNGFVGLSETGTYTLPLKSEDGCDSTITLNLTVVDGPIVAIDNVNATDLIITPNPVNLGNTLYVNAEFTKEQVEGLTVEVFNAVGQLVYTDEPYIYPIEINGLSQRGVYLVRITTGNGNVYQGKVVVK